MVVGVASMAFPIPCVPEKVSVWVAVTAADTLAERTTVVAVTDETVLGVVLAMLGP